MSLLYGIHDREGRHIVPSDGWVLDLVALSENPPPMDYVALKSDVNWIVRVGWGYGSTGTIPLPKDDNLFMDRLAHYVHNSPGVHAWIIGGEPNHENERPDGVYITPARYAHFFVRARTLIKTVSPNHRVVPAPCAPYHANPTNWLDYWRDMLGIIAANGGCDGIAVHAYTRSSNPADIASEAKMGPPLDGQYSGFRTYRDALNAVPASLRHLPAYITEFDELLEDGWHDANTGVVQAAYDEIDNWNKMSGTQKVHCLLLYRWPKFDIWYIEGKQGVVDDFRAAVAQGYQAPEDSEHEVYLPIVGTGEPMPPQPQPPIDIIWDERLTQRGIQLTKCQPAIGEGYWRIVKGEYWEEKEHTFAVTLDQAGARKPDVNMLWWWADGYHEKKTELKPNDRWMIDFPMYAAGWSYGLKALDGPSDSVFGMGLGSVEQPTWGIHVSYHFTFQWTIAAGGTEPPMIPTSRFQQGDVVYTTTQVNLRRSPGYVNKPTGDVIDVLDPGTQVKLDTGPQIKDGLVWWASIQLGGWVAESDPQGTILLTKKQPASIPLLPAPLAGNPPITQVFGVNADFYKQFACDGVPLLGHNGIDLGVVVGTPVFCVDNGTVIATNDEGIQGFGKHIKVRHAWGETLYAHLSSIGMVVNESVRQGQQIGLSGNTGVSTGPHLHFGLRKNGYSRSDGWCGYSDPMPYLQSVDVDIFDIIADAAKEFDVPINLLTNLVFAENRFETDNTPSSAGAVGPAQIMPATFAEWAPKIGAKDITNPRDNVRVGTAYLAYLTKQLKGNVRRVLYAYNWGPGRVIAGHAPPLETVAYADKILYGTELLDTLEQHDKS